MHDLLVSTLAYLVQCFGGNLGCAIIALSLSIRVSLLPLTIRLARRAMRNQEILRTLQPEIDELKKRFEKKPEKLMGEMGRLYKKHNYSPFDLPTIVGSFIQLPIFGIMYSAIQSSLTSSSAFLWIKSLTSPDFMLTLVILALTAGSAYWLPMASENARTTMIVIQVIITSLIVWKLVAGLGLYWASSSLVSLFQSLWLRYRNPANTAAV